MSATVLEIEGTHFWENPMELPEQDELKIQVAPHAKVTLIERLKKGSRCHRWVEAGEFSQVRFITLQELPDDIILEERRQSIASEGASVHFFAFHFGAKAVNSEIFHHGIGKTAKCDTDLVTRTHADQSFHFALKNTYSQKNGSGVITARGVAEDQSTLGIHGTIKIEQTAGGTDCHLHQAILNLSPKAKVKATPTLEIDTNDVKAAHSASVTNLNAETLFYLESRGLEKEAAKQMLVNGFLKDSLAKLDDLPTIQEIIKAYF